MPAWLQYGWVVSQVAVPTTDCLLRICYLEYVVTHPGRMMPCVRIGGDLFLAVSHVELLRCRPHLDGFLVLKLSQFLHLMSI